MEIDGDTYKGITSDIKFNAIYANVDNLVVKNTKFLSS